MTKTPHDHFFEDEDEDLDDLEDESGAVMGVAYQICCVRQ